MKVLILVLIFCFVSVSFATEVDTECSAKNGNREKNIKLEKPVTNTQVGTIQQ